MKWPSFLKKKEILFSAKTSREDLIMWGDSFFAGMRLHDALAFYRQAGHAEGVARIRQAAVERGDFFLFREASEAMDPGDANREELAGLARRAEAAGRWHDALKAFEQLQDLEGLSRARAALEAMRAEPPVKGDGGGD
jgi:hypothetical protein